MPVTIVNSTETVAKLSLSAFIVKSFLMPTVKTVSETAHAASPRTTLTNKYAVAEFSARERNETKGSFKSLARVM